MLPGMDSARILAHFRIRAPVPRPDGADAVGRELPGADPRVAGRVRTHRRVGPLPAWRSGAGTVRSGEGPHAALARRPVRPV